MKRYTESEKQNLVIQIDRLRKEGSTLKASCKKAGVIDASYYAWKKKHRPEEPAGKPEDTGHGDGEPVEERFPV